MTSKGAGIMRKGVLLIGAMAAIVFVAGAVWALPPAPTPTPSIPFPLKASKLISLDFAHAMNPCEPTAPGAVTLHVKGPFGGMRALIGCEPLPGFAEPVPGLRNWWATLTLSQPHGKLVFTGRKFAAGQKVQLGMVLRPSREKLLVFESPGSKAAGYTPMEVTFLDLNVVCPVQTASGTGAITMSTYLDQCLVRPFWIPTPSRSAVDPLTPGSPPPPPLGGKSDTVDKLDKLNIEIVDATLADANGGTCAGGENHGDSCATDADCAGSDGTCTAGACVGGKLNGHPCTGNAGCPLNPGECVYPVFGRAGIVR